MSTTDSITTFPQQEEVEKKDERQGDSSEVALTDSVSRGWKDLDTWDYFGCIFVLTALRCLAIHPMTFALIRKQGDPSKYAHQSTYSIVSKVISSEGGMWNGLCKGAFVYTFGSAAAEVIYLGTFEFMREKFTLESTALKDTVSGYGADACSRIVQTPALVIATRQILDPNRGIHAFSTMKSVYKAGGARSLWAGFATILVGGCSWTGVWWGCYGAGKEGLYSGYKRLLGLSGEKFTPEEEAAAVRRKFGEGKTTSWLMSQGAFSSTDNYVINSVASCGTSGLTGFIFNPYLVVRTRLQAANGQTVRHVVRSVYRESGIRGFWHGAILNVNSCILDAWLASSVYEYAKIFSDTTKQKAE